MKQGETDRLEAGEPRTTKLQVEKRARNLAIFHLAIDRRLHGFDVASLKVEDVVPHRATVR